MKRTSLVARSANFQMLTDLVLALGVFAGAAAFAQSPPRVPEPPVLTSIDGASAQAAFKVFDSTVFQGKPDLRRYGVDAMHVAYEQDVFIERSRSTRPADAMPTDELMRQAAAAARKKRSDYLIIDIEMWSVYQSRRHPKEVGTSVARYISVVQQAKRVAPDLKIGLFSPLPVYAGYERLIASADSAMHAEMVQDNDNLLELARAVDAIFPIGYTMTDNRQEWRYALSKAISEARRLNRGVPVYVFLWPQYSNYGPVDPELHLRWVERDYWRYQLDTVYELGDGVVLWGGWDLALNRRQRWDPTAPWWVETMKFLADKRLSDGRRP